MEEKNKIKVKSTYKAVNKPRSKEYPTPFRLFIITMVSIFLAESAVMAFLALLPPFSVKAEALLDAAILSILVFPPLFFFLLKPMTLNITKSKQLEDELRALSITDELTGLHNRRGFFTLADHLLKRAKREKQGIFMLYTDLDCLKEINDTFGYKEGDNALVDFANILKENHRESDVITRIGGDEFVVIPVGVTGDCVEKVTARLQNKIEIFNVKSERRYKLSVSTGVAYYDPESPCSLDDLLAQRDKLMYEQKMRKKVLPQAIFLSVGND